METSAVFVAITKSDSVAVPTYMGRQIRAVYVGGAGDVTVKGNDEVEVTFKAPPVGTILPIRPKYVMASTTATLLIGLY